MVRDELESLRETVAHAVAVATELSKKRTVAEHPIFRVATHLEKLEKSGNLSGL